MSPGMVVNSEVEESYTSTYEQVIHDVLKLVGAGSKLDLMAR